jgi:hypothetical protein
MIEEDNGAYAKAGFAIGLLYAPGEHTDTYRSVCTNDWESCNE